MVQKIEPANHLSGVLTMPPDKSISHRAAMFAALHKGVSEISNYSPAADPQSTLQVLRQLGIRIDAREGKLTVHGVGRFGFMKPAEPLDCGNAGTLMRLMCGIIGGAGIEATLTGDASLRSRTMKRIIEPLRRMGITIEARKDNYAPLYLPGSPDIKPITFTLPIPSAQLKSCVLLAGLFGDRPTKVIEPISSRDHTERMLQLPSGKADGATLFESSLHTPVPNQSIHIPGDFSAAAFWLVAGCILPGSGITLKNVGLNPTRTASLQILQEMGADITITNESLSSREPAGDIQVRSSALKAITISRKLIPNCIDELPILAVAMIFAEGTSEIRGAEELRHKETDRIKAMAKVMERAGVSFQEHSDGFTIQGNPGFVPHPSTYESYHDHRIAMASAVLSLMSSGMSTIRDAECAAISYPAFYEHLAQLSKSG